MMSATVKVRCTRMTSTHDAKYDERTKKSRNAQSKLSEQPNSNPCSNHAIYTHVQKKEMIHPGCDYAAS